MQQQRISDAALLNITTETPFDKRHDCWFCGEPNQFVFIYQNSFDVQMLSGETVTELSIPSCKECFHVANKSVENAKDTGQHYSIWTIKAEVKKHLLHFHRKDLSIGINWTKQELEESEFEDGNFSGFQRSAWFMFELARDRVNYSSWALIANGIAVVDEYQELSFTFDDVIYPNIEQAILHYANSLSINVRYFHTVMEILGKENFSKAVRFCRLRVAESTHERQTALHQLRVEQCNLNISNNR